MKKLFLSVALLFSLTACDQENLLKDLTQNQANEVLAVLQRHQISAQKVDAGKPGFRVEVKKEDFASAVELLKIYNLPSRARIEIAQMFPSDSLVSSPRAEKARLYSAIEQRLEQSLQSIENVAAARVHVSYNVEGEASVSKSDAQAMHVAVVLVCEAAADQQLVSNNVKRIVRNAFTDIDYENISVVVSKKQTLLPFNNNVTTVETTMLQKYPAIWFAIGLFTGLIIVAVVFFILRPESLPFRRVRHEPE